MLITDEETNIDMLTSMMGDAIDREMARRVLRKYDGDIDKAATAMLEGERGDDQPQPQSQDYSQSLPHSQSQSQSQSNMWGTGSSMNSGIGIDIGSLPQPAVRPNTPAVDLTGDDDGELQRAMRESMNTLQPQGPIFGPSERPTDPSWALVPSSNQENTSEEYYLHSLERAIEASLEHNNAPDADALEPLNLEQQLRRDGCPVVLRPSAHTLCYGAAILQGLFYVPQVRARVAAWRPSVAPGMLETSVPTSGPDGTLWALCEIFAHMDLARLCDLNVDKHLPVFNIEPWTSLIHPPGEPSQKFFTKLSATLEKAFVDQVVHIGEPSPSPRLFHFLYSNTGEHDEVLQETCIVPIDVGLSTSTNNHSGGGWGGDAHAHDLIGRLSSLLAKPHDASTKQSVIVEPSEVVAFQLTRPSSSSTTTTTTTSAPSSSLPGGAASGSRRFSYPVHIHLDPFLRAHAALAEELRARQHAAWSEVQKLILRKKSLTQFNGNDTLREMRSTIHYYKYIASDGGDPERAASIQAMAGKLESIVHTIEAELKEMDEKIDVMREEAAGMLECPELKQVRYDLRVVFMHDGLYGRKHLYCYVRDRNKWWKIADSIIEQVTEAVVLNDTTGLHLGAGPYLLFYSRVLPGEEEDGEGESEGEGGGMLGSLPWPQEIQDDVRRCNAAFVAQLPPELVGDIKDARDILMRDMPDDTRDVTPPGPAPALAPGGAVDGVVSPQTVRMGEVEGPGDGMELC